MHQCPHCNGRGVIAKGNTYISCPECLTPERFLTAIDKAIKECKRENKQQKLEALLAVKSFLPEYPVMAFLEAEGRNLNPKFVSMLQSSFGVREFRDQNYLGESLTVQETAGKIQHNETKDSQESEKNSEGT